MFRISRRTLIIVGMAWGISTQAQVETVPPQEPSAAAAPLQVEPTQNAALPCVQPPPVVRWQDYQGPFRKVVGAFGRRLERKSVHAPHYKPGAILCSLTLGGKFELFVEDTFDPVTFLSVSFNAGIAQAENSDAKFGQGAAGYGKRFGANLADQASSEFFKDVTYATIFKEDPRYYRQAHGSNKGRLLHSLDHAVVARRENGTMMFNASEWLGTASAAALADAYHPGLKPGVGPAAERLGFGIAQDVGFDVLREFWPEVTHKFKLPFRDQNEPPAPAPVPVPKS